MFSFCFRLPPAQRGEIDGAQEDLNDGGSGGSQADAEQGGVGQSAHQVGNRDSDEKGAGQTLTHDEKRFSPAVIIADEAE